MRNISIIIIFMIILIIISGCIFNDDESDKKYKVEDIESNEKLLSGKYIKSFSISKDEKYLVYCKTISEEKDYNSNDINEIWTYNLDTKENKKVCPCNTVWSYPIFKEDHTKIIFHEDGNIIQIDFDGKNKQNLTTDGGSNPIYLRDYSKIIFEKEGPEETIIMYGRDESGSVSNIWIMDSDGGNQKQLTNFSYPFNPDIDDISPDNLKILFSIRQHGHAVERRRSSFDEMEDMHGLWEINVDGTNLHRIIDGEKGAMEYSPDGRKILFYTSIYYHHTYFWIINTDGSNERELSPSHDFEDYYGWVKFHPNGKDILYSVSIATKLSKDELWLIDYNGSNPRKVITITDDIYQVDFLNNGNKILYKVYNQETGMNEIWLIEL